MGVSAWAETYTGTVNFEAKSRSTYANGTFTTASNAGNGYALAVADLSALENIESATSVTLEFDVTVSGRLLMGIGDKTMRGTNANSSNKSTYNTDGLVMRYGTDNGSYVRVNGGTNNSNLLNTSSHVKFTLDRTTSKYSYTITYVNGESEIQTGLTGSDLSTSVSNATIVEAYSWSGDQSNALSSVTYSYEYSPSSFDYTVKAVTAEGTELKTFASGTSIEAVTTYYPYAINVDGDWYTTAASSYAVTVSAIKPDAPIVYEKDEQIVGFYEETTSGKNAQYSNGAYGTVAAQNKRDRGTGAGTLAPGKYQFIARLVADGNSGRAITLREGANDPIVSAIANNSTKTETVEFTIYKQTGSLFINGANSGTEKTNLSTSFDYIIIKRIGEATIPVTIAEGKEFATYNSDYALDFTDVEGLTAYTAKVNADGSEVTLTKVEGKVPAYTGLLVRGATANVPVVAAAEDVDNDFIAVTAENCDEGQEYMTVTEGYILATVNGVQGFWKANSTSGTKVAKGKAYLPATGAQSARLTLNFGEETTGVSEIRTMTIDNNVYNLNGVRVAQPQKGLYIMNGKKVVIK